MMKPETWKIVWEAARNIWTAIGPMLGVLIGALLARSSERQKWMNDNRKEECRELLTAMTRAADMYLEERSRRPTMKQDDFIAQKEAFAEYRRCLIVLQDRISLSVAG